MNLWDMTKFLRNAEALVLTMTGKYVMITVRAYRETGLLVQLIEDDTLIASEYSGESGISDAVTTVVNRYLNMTRPQVDVKTIKEYKPQQKKGC